LNLSDQIAKQFRAVYYGGNFAGVNLKETLEGITWQQATAKVYSFNTIAALVFHINYYVSAILKVLQGGPLDAHDKYSYDFPPVRSAEDWQKLMDTIWTDGGNFANLVEQLDETKFGESFLDGKYGTYFRNLSGVIEHIHYHLGQIVLIKKILLQRKEN